MDCNLKVVCHSGNFLIEEIWLNLTQTWPQSHLNEVHLWQNILRRTNFTVCILMGIMCHDEWNEIERSKSWSLKKVFQLSTVEPERWDDVSMPTKEHGDHRRLHNANCTIIQRTNPIILLGRLWADLRDRLLPVCCHLIPSKPSLRQHSARTDKVRIPTLIISGVDPWDCFWG